MNRRFRTAAIAIVLVGGMAAAARADTYSGPGFSGEAHMAQSGKPLKKMGMVNVDEAGFRMDISAEGQHVISLLDWTSKTAIALMPAQKMYMEVPPEQSGWTAYENRACSGYGGGTKLGDETLNGRPVEKWRCTGQLNTPQGKTPSDATVWYDAELQFETKVVEDDGGVFEIRNIRIGRQDASLFQIPPGYSKFDVNAMMMQMQQQQQSQ